MPRTRSLAWSELKLGVLTIVALVIAAVTDLRGDGRQGFFWQRYSLKTRFANVAGLKTGSPVRVAGMEVGTVTEVEFAGDQVDVAVRAEQGGRARGSRQLDRDARVGVAARRGRRRHHAVVERHADSGVGLRADGQDGGRAWRRHRRRRRRASTRSPGSSRTCAAGKGTVGKLMTDEQLYNELTEFVTTAGDVTRTIRQGRGTAGRLINDPKIANSLEASLKNLEEMTRRINAGEGSLGKLLKDDAFATSLTGATTNLRTLTDRLNKAKAPPES